MRNSVAFASAILTTFVMVVVAGVVYAYRAQAASEPVVQQTAVQQPVTVQDNIAAAPANSDVSPQAAASIAARFLNRTDLYSVALAAFNGVQAYKVTFSSGDVVYLDMQGQVLGAAPPTPSVVASSPSGNTGGARVPRDRGSGGGAEHEDAGGVEHEDGAG